MTGRDQSKLPCGCGIQQPRGQHALIDDGELLDLDAFGVERLRAQSAHPQRIVDDADVLGEQLLAEPILEETGLARNRRTVDRADQMTDQRSGNPRIKHDRHLAGLDLARVGARHRALARGAADAFGRRQINRMRRSGEVIVALHAGAFARDRGHRDALARPQVGAVKAGRGHQHHAANSSRGRPAARLGHALDGEAGGLRLAGPPFQFRRRRNLRIQQIEVGKIPRQQRRIREADILIVRRNARHRHRTLGKPGDTVAAHIVGRNHRLPLSYQHAQSDVVAFGALGFLDAPVAHFNALRNTAHRNRVGGIRACASRGLHEALRQRAEGGLIEQAGSGGVR